MNGNNESEDNILGLPIPSQHALYEEICTMIDNLGISIPAKIENLRRMESARIQEHISGLEKAITGIRSEFATKLTESLQNEHIRALEANIQDISKGIEKINSNIVTNKSKIVELKVILDHWPSETLKLEDEARLLKKAIDELKTSKAASDPRATLRGQKRSVSNKPSYHVSASMKKIISLQSAISNLEKQLDDSRANPELVDYIRAVHVCRGMIETAPNLSAETKSKLRAIL